jgi:two-component system response regulator PilR (NtrC family)
MNLLEAAAAGAAIVIAVLLGFGLFKRRRAARVVKKGVEAANLSPHVQKPRQNELLYKAILDSVPIGVAITDLDGNIRYFNAQAEALTLFRERSVMGGNLGQIFPAIAEELNKRIREKQGLANELRLTDVPGRNNHLRLTLIPPTKLTAHPDVFVVVLEDIAKREEVQDIAKWREEVAAKTHHAAAEKVRVMLGKAFHFEGAIGPSEEMQKIYRLIQAAAGTSANLLVTGESGTGKKMVARAIHLNGPRKDKPFISVNCGSIAETLVEDELFGHVRGAFTGAVSDYSGRLKLADGGTILLEEIEKLPPHLQAKLLKVLEGRALTPIGGTKLQPVDLRVITATDKDLRHEMEQGQLRNDLFYRLSVLQINLPPLRDRKEDVPFLLNDFIKKFAQVFDKKVEKISPEALRSLMHYNYPKNIRELESIIQHAVAVTEREILTTQDLPIYGRENLPSDLKLVLTPEDEKLLEITGPAGEGPFFDRGSSVDDALALYEKTMLLAALKKAGGVQKRAAELLGINYRSFRHRLEKYGMLESKIGDGGHDKMPPEP